MDYSAAGFRFSGEFAVELRGILAGDPSAVRERFSAVRRGALAEQLRQARDRGALPAELSCNYPARDCSRPDGPLVSPPLSMAVRVRGDLSFGRVLRFSELEDAE